MGILCNRERVNLDLNYIRVQMQRSRSGDRQPPPRGGGPDLGKEIMMARQGDGAHA